MNKSQIINHVATSTEFNKTESGKILEAILVAITHGLHSDGKVRILGFGGFEVKDTKERKGRNPQTGSEITIKARKKIMFHPSNSLKQEL